MKRSLLRLAGITASVIGIAATLISDWVDEKKMEEKGDTMSDWKGKIEKEKSDSSTGKAENRSRTQKEKQIDEYVLLKQERVYLSCFNSTKIGNVYIM